MYHLDNRVMEKAGELRAILRPQNCQKRFAKWYSFLNFCLHYHYRTLLLKTIVLE